MQEEKFISSILHSIDGMTKVVPSDTLLSKIESRIRKQNKVSEKTVWLAAASIALLFAINFTFLKFRSNEKTTASSVLEKSIYKSNQLY